MFNRKDVLNTGIILGLSGLLLACTDTQPGVTDSVMTDPTPSQEQLTHFANTLNIRYQVLSNHGNDACHPDNKESPCFTAQITLESPQNYTQTGWEIYFSHIAPIRKHHNPRFNIEHINGDLHRLTPTSTFTKFDAGKQETIDIEADFWHLSETDPMPNYYVVADGLEAQVIASTQPQTDSETGLEQLPFIKASFDPEKNFKRHAEDQSTLATANQLWQQDKNAQLITSGLEYEVLPTPKSLIKPSAGGTLDLAQGLTPTLEGFSNSDVAAAFERLSALGIESHVSGVPVRIEKSTANDRKSGSYTLDITQDDIYISAADAEGAANALHTIAGLLQLGSSQIAQLKIIDEPRYAFRGLHVDVARNFHSKGMILRLLEQMAAYKLNKLHLHLADDEGWRLEIPGLPELTEIGSRRCHDLSEDTCLLPQLGSGPNKNAKVNGFYSTGDYLEILAAASARHIQVIPSLDMPGHSRAATKSMEARYRKYSRLEDSASAQQYLLSEAEDTTVYSSIQFYSDNTLNVCIDSTYRFVEKVIDELQNLHAQANHPLTRYHIGADETAGAWVDSPSCQTLIAENDELQSSKDLGPYFVERIAAMLEQKNIEVAGWGDGMGHVDPKKMPAFVQSNAWTPLPWGGHKEAHTQANLGWEVIISTPDATYFDTPYQADPKERGFYWATRSLSSRKVFDFMPDNLPAHAEFWPDRDGKAFSSDDRPQHDDQGNPSHTPMRAGIGFAGLQGQLWSETVRSDEQAEYMIYPRLMALAERAWHKPEWAVNYDHNGVHYSADSRHFSDEKRRLRDADWNRFANLLGQRELAKLDLMGIHYRLPTVGAQSKQGQLQAASVFPGLKIEYRTLEGNWQPYHSPTAINSAVELRSVSPDGQRRGRSLTVSP